MISEARTKRISEGVARDEGVDAESWLHGQERLTYGMVRRATWVLTQMA